MDRIIGGAFSDVESAERTISHLKDIGYTRKDISVLAKDRGNVSKIENDTGTDATTNEGGRGKNSGKGAGIGAISGGVLGGLVGLVAEIGLLTIPGIGILAAAGPMATTLSGTAIGAGSGGIIGALVGAGIPEEQAKQYEQYLKDGKIIVLVEAGDDNQQIVYRSFLSNKPMNTEMYPEDVVIAQKRPNF
ncbi:low temperature-induced protein [Virgibacillus xinjiangensis]|uniref:Low temperature-induced protein n=1 Tax=Virgibacillus xinjiangensis TaxID=393090 RepID=A0ABV7CR62_9BACI